jgi:hypothetical protein
MIRKVNIVNDWYYRHINPLCDEQSIFSKECLCRIKTIPITSLHQVLAWKFLADGNWPVIAVDPRHWYFDDDTFHRYVDRLSSLCRECDAAAVIPFDSPFGYERPSFVSPDLMESWLTKRAEYISESFRTHSPDTSILSPGISLGPADFERRTVSFVINNRALFDCYAVHCFGEISQSRLARLSKMLSNVLSAFSKPLWVTHWAASAYDRDVPGDDLKLPSHKQAALGLNNSFEMIDGLAKGNSVWFFTGFTEDLYNPAFNSPMDHSDPIRLLWTTKGVGAADKWDEYHFTGLIDYVGRWKLPVLQEVKSLAS